MRHTRSSRRLRLSNSGIHLSLVKFGADVQFQVSYTAKNISGVINTDTGGKV